MKLAILPVTPYQQNCSLVVCTRTNRAALVDPGGEVDRLLAAVAKTGATLEKVLVTHGHVDHCGGAAEVAERTGVPIEGPHREDAFWIDGLHGQGASFGVPGARPFTPDRWLEDGDVATVGEIAFDVLHCERCGGRAKIVSAISAPKVVDKILAHLRNKQRQSPAAPRAPPIGGDLQSLLL